MNWWWMHVHWKEESMLQAGGKSLLKEEFYANMNMILSDSFYLPLFQHNRKDPHAILHLWVRWSRLLSGTLFNNDIIEISFITFVGISHADTRMGTFDEHTFSVPIVNLFTCLENRVKGSCKLLRTNHVEKKHKEMNRVKIKNIYMQKLSEKSRENNWIMCKKIDMSSILPKRTKIKPRWLAPLTHPLNTLMHESISSWQNSLELLQTFANFFSEKTIHDKCGCMKILSRLYFVSTSAASDKWLLSKTTCFSGNFVHSA